MGQLFVKILNMSITATWIALAVTLVRIALKKRAPRRLICVLWGLVGLRLVLPFAISSPFSLVPSAEPVKIGAASSAPTVATGFERVDGAVNGVINRAAERVPEGAFPSAVDVIAVIWAAGAALMVIYAVVSYVRVYLRVRESVKLEDGIYVCDRISTPFLFGIFKPKIYIPSSLDAADRFYVIAHEASHIARRDYLWKPLGFFLLSVNWFNPAMWVAYVLLCRDIEFACDERVISSLGSGSKKEYSMALLNCSVTKRMISACPVAFGETGVKGRVKNVLSYKRPTFWIIAASVAATVALAFCFLTNPNAVDGADIPEPPEPETETVAVIPARHVETEHDYVQFIIKEAACAESGEAKYVCSECGDSYTAAIPPLGHRYKAETVREANCADTLLVRYTCALCGDAYEEEGESDPEGHSYYHETSYEATCKRPGYDTYRCSLCGDWYMDYYGYRTDHEFTPSDDRPDICAICGAQYLGATRQISIEKNTVSTSTSSTSRSLFEAVYIEPSWVNIPGIAGVAQMYSHLEAIQNPSPMRWYY